MKDTQRVEAKQGLRVKVFERPVYKLPLQMQILKERLVGMPRPINMGSPAQTNWVDFWRD